VSSGVRADGRGRLSLRPLCLSLGVLPGSGGSARASAGAREPGSDVLCSIKVELVPSGAGELAIAASWFGWSGRAADERASALAAELAFYYCGEAASAAPSPPPLAAALVIVPGRFAFRLCADVVVLRDGGALLETAAAALVAALRGARLPALRAVRGEAAGDVELELDEDPLASAALPDAALAALPLVLAVTAVAGDAVVDALPEEEACADGRVVVGAARDGGLRGARASGRAGVEPATLAACLRAAARLAPPLFARLDAAHARALAELEDDGGADGRREKPHAPTPPPGTALLQGRR
jgi:exosome complex RNA-binding protein Rrp42 (RNase PH superfamily)